MTQQIHQHTFPNGLTLLAERMDHVRSAAVNFLVPAGCAFDPPGRDGLASVVSDMITRGAGGRDSRQLSEAFDTLGVDHDEVTGPLTMRFYGSMLSRNVPDVLELYADVLRRPHLPGDELEAVQALTLQDIQALEDSPQQKVFIELRKRAYPPPLNKDRRGTPEGIEAVTAADVRAFHGRFGPNGTILSVAGNVEWGPLVEQVGRLFGDWRGGEPAPRGFGRVPAVTDHVEKETTQTHIALMCGSVPLSDPDYYPARGAVHVLSGGMSARLFTEVREKRGLVYSVYASHESFRDRGNVLAYAGTRTERAQETLDVMVAELRRLAEGVTAEEVERVQAGLKSSLIMQEESTSARAGSIASDWFLLGRVRTSDEIRAAIDALTPDAIAAHLRRHPYRDFSVVTLGPKPLAVPA